MQIYKCFSCQLEVESDTYPQYWRKSLRVFDLCEICSQRIESEKEKLREEIYKEKNKWLKNLFTIVTNVMAVEDMGPRWIETKVH